MKTNELAEYIYYSFPTTSRTFSGVYIREIVLNTLRTQGLSLNQLKNIEKSSVIHFNINKSYTKQSIQHKMTQVLQRIPKENK